MNHSRHRSRGFSFKLTRRCLNYDARHQADVDIMSLQAVRGSDVFNELSPCGSNQNHCDNLHGTPALNSATLPLSGSGGGGFAYSDVARVTLVRPSAASIRRQAVHGLVSQDQEILLCRPFGLMYLDTGLRNSVHSWSFCITGQALTCLRRHKLIFPISGPRGHVRTSLGSLNVGGIVSTFRGTRQGRSDKAVSPSGLG